MTKDKANLFDDDVAYTGTHIGKEIAHCIDQPQRTWIGLTSQDMKDPRTHNFDFVYGAMWAEAKLKEKNS